MKKCIDCKKDLSTNYSIRCRKCSDIFRSGEKSSNYVHGMRNTRFYRIFTDMKTRCNNPKQFNYFTYGKRGIKCFWNSFEEFKNDMYEPYLKHVKKFGEKDTQIDRINVNGNYEKSNCRWVTCKSQQRNRRNNRLITFNGKTMCLAEWAEKIGIAQHSLRARIIVYKWPIKKAFSIPPIIGRNQFF